MAQRRQRRPQEADGPAVAAMPESAERYMETGFCFYCREVLMAKQPGGKDPIHKDGSPYCGNKGKGDLP
jgi:hypothetical protein